MIQGYKQRELVGGKVQIWEKENTEKLLRKTKTSKRKKIMKKMV